MIKRYDAGDMRGIIAFENYHDCAVYNLDSNGCKFSHCNFFRVTFVNCSISRDLFHDCQFWQCVFKGFSCVDQIDKHSAPIMYAYTNRILDSYFYVDTEEDAAAFRALFIDGTGFCWLGNSNIILDTNKYLSKLIKMQCPEAGSFVGYKKALHEDALGFIRRVIIRLTIPEDAKRSSAFGKKCRCSKAVVEDIVDPTTEHHIQTAMSSYSHNFKYTVGETISIDNFDENRFNECAPGIHFFMAEEDAEKYLL